MPIQDGKYVSPDWSNSSPPPINASELNALSETVEKADTNYTRDEILSDEVKQLIGLDETATPNDAFSRITLGNKRYGVNLYVKYQDETPASGITITSSGSLPIDGSMVTDENGYLFLAQDSTSFTASIDNADGKLYIDLEENPSVSATLSQTITTVNLIWNFNENAIKIDASKTVTFSNSVKTFDVCAVGGGGGGGAGGGAGGGGGGGYTTNVLGNKTESSKQISVSIGAGGKCGAFHSIGYDYAKSGGNTIVKYNNKNICSAKGGSGGGTGNNVGTGGAGSGAGGNGAVSTSDYSGVEWHGLPGNNSSTYIFNEQSLGLAGGGGGGGASAANKYNPLPANYNAPGGQPFGATGACSIYNMSDGSTQKAGAGNPSGPGGGGGGEANGGGSRGADGSNGNKGVVYLRFHH